MPIEAIGFTPCKQQPQGISEFKSAVIIVFNKCFIRKMADDLVNQSETYIWQTFHLHSSLRPTKARIFRGEQNTNDPPRFRRAQVCERAMWLMCRLVSM